MTGAALLPESGAGRKMMESGLFLCASVPQEPGRLVLEGHGVRLLVRARGVVLEKALGLVFRAVAARACQPRTGSWSSCGHPAGAAREVGGFMALPLRGCQKLGNLGDRPQQAPA
jgi:hypothetical protein